MYDQALKVELESGLRYIANFRYNIKPSVSTEPLTDENLQMDDMHSGDYGKFNSDCSKTMVGFVQSIPSVTGERHSLKDLKATCFVGNLDKPVDIDNLQEFSKVNSLMELTKQSDQANSTAHIN